MSNRIYISPSAQEHNIGAGTYGTEEMRMNAIADIVENLLKQHGPLFTTFRNRPNMTLQQIVDASNKLKAEIHVAIHSNAASSQVQGTEMFAMSAEGKKLATFIYNEVAPLSPGNDRGIKDGSHLYEVKKTNAKTALIEVAFHTNPIEAQWIINETEKIAEGIYRGICKYYGVQPIFKPKPQPKSDKLFKVQVGAFSDRANADRLVADLKAKGFSPFITQE